MYASIILQQGSKLRFLLFLHRLGPYHDGNDIISWLMIIATSAASRSRDMQILLKLAMACGLGEMMCGRGFLT